MSGRAAFLAGLMIATSLLLNVEARLAKTDAMLLLCCVAAMGVMARAYLRQADQRDIRWSHAAILWTAIAAGMLYKGPPILAGSRVAALSGSDPGQFGRRNPSMRPVGGALGGARQVMALVVPS